MNRWLRNLMRRPKPSRTEFASAMQIEFIEGVCEELGRQPPDNLEQLTGAEANVLIEALMVERGRDDYLDEEPLEPRPGPR